MTPKSFHLAQVNIARMRASIVDPVMEGFVAQLEFINACAERSPGFVWRLQSEAGDATGLEIFEDPTLLINMTVWESMEALYHYVYKSAHLKPLQNRKSWFKPMDRSHLALWWIQKGYEPTIAEAELRLSLLQERGPTSEAFTFKEAFPPPVAAPDQTSGVGA